MMLGCTSDQFKCDNGKCIPKYHVGNGENNCGDFSDERKQFIKYNPEFIIYITIETMKGFSDIKR